MSQHDLIVWTAVTGLLSALATGLGAIPVALVRRGTARWEAMASAVAAGMMISASVFSLAQKGIAMQAQRPWAPYEVVLGLMMGAGFLWLAERRLDGGAPPTQGWARGAGRRGVLIFLGMLIHSFPEGMAIGVGFATGDLEFGILMALAISVHNIPEGIAISLPLHAEGMPIGRCALFSIVSSLPQPLMAVPSALAAWFFQPLLATGLGFAGGAMIYLAVAELLPEAFERGGKELAAWGVMLGLAGMLLTTVLLDTLGI